MRLRRADALSIVASTAAAMLAFACPMGADARAADYRVTGLPAVVLPGGGGKDLGSTVELAPYQVLATADLAYAKAAALEAPIDVTIAGQHVAAASGEILPGFRVTGGALGAAEQIAYCLAPTQAPRGSHLAREIRPCFVDRNGDRRLDAAFLAGARRDEDMALVPVDAPFAERTDVPIPGAAIEVVFHVNWEALAIQLAAEGRTFVITRIRFGTGEWSTSHPDISGSVYPRTITFGAAQFEVLGYDRRARHARARILAPFQRSEVEFEFPSNVTTLFIPVVR